MELVFANDLLQMAKLEEVLEAFEGWREGMEMRRLKVTLEKT